MKTFTRVCLILAAICGIAGLGFAGGAVALGASFGQVKEALSGDGLWNRIHYEFWDRWHDGGDEFHFDYDEGYMDSHGEEHGDFWKDGGQYHTYGFSGADILKVDVKRCAVYLQESEDEKLYLEVRQNGAAQEVKVQETGGTVTVSSDSNERPESEIYIYLPEDAEMEEIQIDAGSSYVTMDYVQAEKLDVSVGAGSVEVCGRVEAVSSSWSVGAGQIYACMDGEEEDYNYEIECGVGAVQFPQADYSGLGTVKQVDNEADREMKIQCGIGSVEVMFEE